MAEHENPTPYGRVEELPAAVREELDRLLADRANSYTEIAAWLEAQGYEMDKHALWRYAARAGAECLRLRQAVEQSRKLIQSLKDHEDTEAGEVASALLLDALLRRIANAEEELNALPVEKAGQMLASLQRATAYRERVQADKRRMIAQARQAILDQLSKLVQEDQELMDRLSELVNRAGQEALHGNG